MTARTTAGGRRTRTQHPSSRLPTRQIQPATSSQLRHLYKDLLRGSIAPKSFAAWLGVVTSPLVVAKGLQQNFFVIVRACSIKHLGKALSSNGWKHVWEGLGSTPGLLDLFSDLSVNEVRQACKVIGKCARFNDVLEKRKCVTELFKSLQPHIFTDASLKSKDYRPLNNFYRYLISSCTEDLVERIVAGNLKGVWKPIRQEYLMRYHPDIARREQLRTLEPDSEASFTLDRLRGLIGQYPMTGTTPRRPVFTPPMDFALQVLRRIVIDGSSQLDEEVFINDLVRPLLNRCIKKKVPWPITKDVVDLTMRYLDKYSHVGVQITMMRGDVRHLVAPCWTRKPDLFADSFRSLCSHAVFGTKPSTEPFGWGEFMDGVPVRQRYALFCFCFEASTGLDVDNDEHLGRMIGQLDAQLLAKFTAHEALGIFKRLRAARGDDNLVMVRGGDTILSITLIFRRPAQDPDIAFVHLLNQNGNFDQAREVATQRIARRKKEAEKGSEPEQRTIYVKYAIYYAVASGDLQILHEIFDWTRRFVRDPLVCREIYPQNFPCEVYTRLTGIPNSIDALNLEDLQARVQAANNLMRSIFDTACAARREPSFRAGDWWGVLNMFRPVKKGLKASDNELYTALWESAIDMLLGVEARANQPENRRLSANSIRGPMDCTWESSADLKSTEPSVYRFLDELAKLRDGFWQTLRPKYQPAVLGLPEPYPRGLPIQHLITPWVLDEPHLENAAPYIASPVKAVFFPIPEAVQQPVSDDVESAVAIGGFVDSYKHALRLYVSKSGSRKYREHRLKQAWTYATSSMNCGRMDSEEAFRFWKTKGPYKEALAPPSKRNFMKSTWPQIPDIDDPCPVQRHEWNPFTSRRPDQPARTLEILTYLDLSLIIHDRRENTETPWSALDNLSPLIVPGNRVETRSIWFSDRNMGEGGVLSALMYLEMMYGASEGSLVSLPFPSAQYALYPALYLDPECHGDPLNPYTAVRSIQARNMMAKLAASDRGEAEDDSVQELALNLILRLTESDRPAFAIDLVIKTILERPEASSWHRKLLKPKFLKRLRRKVAEICFRRFSAAVLERVRTEEDKADSDGGKLAESGRIDVAPTKPFAKITTIKFLAQILRDVETVDESSALPILCILLDKASHIDVRLNTIKSLLHMLDTASSENDRKSSSRAGENDWIKAEDSGVLPAYPDMDDQNPTMRLFVEHFRCCDTVAPERQQLFISRILLPTLTHHQRQISRWARLFLRKHDVVANVPVLPQHTTQLLRHLGTSFPQTALSDLVSYMIVCIAPPPAIFDLNARLRASKAELESIDVQTWFRLYGSTLASILTFRGFDILSLLDRPTILAKGNCITPDVITWEYLRAFKAIVPVDAPLYTRLTDSFLPTLVSGKYATRPWWGEHGKSIVREMITFVNTLHTKEWVRDPNRSPCVFPQTFPWRILLLDFPWPTAHTPEIDNLGCKQFADQLGAVLDGMCAGSHRLRIATRLSSHAERTTHAVARSLKIDVARYLLALVQDDWASLRDSEGKADARRMVERWKIDEREAVRRIAVGQTWVCKSMRTIPT
ncbi:hypothetical protein BDU57DRAFT_556158 [Ampelomyces quisqualis]|uniref:Uncharacterized protein n=1 Tax=Ampelomyces quisqualis TaxID=50730 RepID=A0A6A5QJX8_AMPQU|nr:hypothetical protein BDU57DRAFT_556158 [Ampelomyces quisqualis]